MECSICGKEITKRNSYALENGTRACKGHDLTDKLPKPKPVYPKAEKKKRENRYRTYDMRPKCFHCETSGIMKQEFAYRSMIEMSKYEKENGKPVNIFSTEYNVVIKAVREHFGFLEHEKVGVLDRIYVGNLEEWKVRQLIKPQYTPVVAMSDGLCLLCGECQKEFDLVPKMPELDMKQLMLLGSITKPYIDGIAEKELDSES